MFFIHLLLLIFPLTAWSQSDCHHELVRLPTTEDALPSSFLSSITAVQDQVMVANSGGLNNGLVCEWMRNARRSNAISSLDELPEWDDEIEKRYTRTSGLGRLYNTVGSSLIRGVDMFHGFTPSRIEEILNELPERMAQFERTSNLSTCAPLLQKVADKCLNGNTDMNALYPTLTCGRMASTECMKVKCGLEITNEQLQSCRNLIPPSTRDWGPRQEMYKYTSFMTGLYLAKNEPAGRTLDQVPGETQQQRIVRRTINHVMGSITPNNEFDERVDTPMDALERGGTNCLGYGIMISSALKYSTAGTGVKSEIITHVTPAHAWNRITLTDPQISFDIDGSQYGLHYKPGRRPTHEFLPLPPRNSERRNPCQMQEPQTPFCTANVSGSEITGERGSTDSAQRNRGRTASGQ